jgi:predicted RNA binding protein YcfA (HicA-like mRNA interferase family)
MKRKEILNHLKQNGCIQFREGKKHTLFINPKNNKISTIPRHNEINEFLVLKICKDLDIDSP